MLNNITQNNKESQDDVVYIVLLFVCITLVSLSVVSQANFFIEQTGANHHWLTMVYASIPALSFVALGGLSWVFLSTTTNKISKVFWVIIITLSIFLEMVSHLYYWQQGSNKSVAATEQGLMIKERIVSLNEQIKINNTMIENINDQLKNNVCASKFPSNQTTNIRNCENSFKKDIFDIQSSNNNLGLQLDEKTKALTVIAPSTLVNFNISIQKFLNLDIDFKLIMSFLMSVFVSLATNVTMGVLLMFHFPNYENIQYNQLSRQKSNANDNNEYYVDKAIFIGNDRDERSEEESSNISNIRDVKKKDIISGKNNQLETQVDMPNVKLLANKLNLELNNDCIDEIAGYFKNHDNNSVRGIAAVKNRMGIKINQNTISAARKELSDSGYFDGFSTDRNVFKKT